MLFSRADPGGPNWVAEATRPTPGPALAPLEDNLGVSPALPADRGRPRRADLMQLPPAAGGLRSSLA